MMIQSMGTRRWYHEEFMRGEGAKVDIGEETLNLG